MKIKINQDLLDADGKTIKDVNGSGNLTLKKACIVSLLAPNQTDKEKEKLDKYDVFKKFRDSVAEVDLTSEEIVLTKRAIGEIQAPLILGQCFEMLEKK